MNNSMLEIFSRNEWVLAYMKLDLASQSGIRAAAMVEAINNAHEPKHFYLLKLIDKVTALFNRAAGLKLPVNGLTKTDTPPTTITLETLRTSAAIFRRVGICA